MRGTNRHTWGFRLFLVVLNVGGLLWIHHSATHSPSPRLRVLSALPARDVDAADRFSLVFDEPLLLAGGFNPGARVAEPLFVVEPQVPGEWVWAAPERLEYQLTRPLPPGRQFKLRPSPHLERLTGRTLVGPSEFTFQTRPLRLQECRPASSDREHAGAELSFNQPVDPAELLTHLKVLDAASLTPLRPQCLTQAPAERLTIRFPRPASQEVRIELDAGLTGRGGELGLGSKVVRTLQVSPLFTLLSADVDAPGLGLTSIVRLEFTHHLAVDQPAPAVRLTPAVPGLQTRIGWGGLILEGPFTCGQQYHVAVDGGLLAYDGRSLDYEAGLSFEVPDRNPQVRIPLRSGILSPHGNLALDLRVANVNSLRVELARVHANNLAAHLRGEGRRGTSRELPQKTVSLILERNAVATLALDLHELLGEGPQGVYHVEAKAADRTWISDEAVVAVTDLAITNRTERDGLCVWVTSLRSAQPVAGAEVAALSYNGQVLAAAVSDASGIARLSIPSGHPDGEAWLITAQAGDDLSFLKLGERAWVLDSVDHGGRKAPVTYDVMLYSDRGVYRPGDTVHLTGIVRDAHGQIPPELPLSVRVRRPDGREIVNLPVRAEPTRQGLFQVDFTPREDGQTGPYRVTATLPGSDEALGQARVLVEEYVPLRLEVRAEPVKRRFGPGDEVAVRVASRYLFDQPAAGLAVKASGRLRRVSFKSQRFADYCFDDPSAGNNEHAGEAEAVLDEQGLVTVNLLLADDLAAGLWRGEFFVTVSEAGGRSVSDHVEFEVDTVGRHTGLRLPARVVPVGAPVTAEWVQVSEVDELSEPQPMMFSLYRVEQDVSLQQVDGRLVWKSAERVTAIDDQELDITDLQQAHGTFEIRCPASGRYRLEAVQCDSGVTTRIEFHASDQETEGGLLTTGNPERLELILDQNSYVPGDMARLLVRTPFPGTLLVTLETDRVMDWRVVEVAGDTAELEWALDRTLRGGAFFSASLVRAIDPTRETWLPHRAMGMARLVTDHGGNELPLAIAAPAKARPGERTTVTIQTSSPHDPDAPGIVHLWAVDEGILMATAYRTPHPIEHFFAPRRSFVTAADCFGDLLPDYLRPVGMTRIGGDGDQEEVESLRHSPVRGPRRAPALIWLAAMTTDPDGTASVDLQLPELNGELRLMAIAVEGDRYGATQHAVTLAAPLLAEMSGPRFAAPNDRFEMPVKLFNATEQPVRLGVELQVEGPVRAALKEAFDERVIQPNEPLTIWIEAVTSGLGPAKVQFKATSTDMSEPLIAIAEAAFAVRPGGPLHAETRLLRTTAGQLLTIEPLGSFLSDTARTTLSIAASPTVHLQPALEQLIEYPYGCVEQTISRLWALLYAPDLLRGQPGSMDRAEALAGMVDGGLSRLWSMQTRSGGLGYWPGDSESYLWGSAYAGELLVEARRAGYAPDEGFVRELARYLQLQLAQRDGDEMDDNMRAHVCSVLSALSEPPLGWLARLSERPDRLDMAGRAQLAAAWLEAGRKDRALAILAEDTLAGTVATTTGGRLTSQIRQEAVLLRVLLALDRAHAWVPSLVERLEKARKAGQWGSTLENGSALAALALYQTLAPPAASFEGEVLAGGSRRAFNHAGVTTLKVLDDGQPIEVHSTGEGHIYISITTEGLLREGGPVHYDRQLRVSRRWTNRKGQPVDPAHLKVGDLVLVDITLAAPGLTGSQAVENVAIVDALPAGLEVENPRLAGSERSHEPSDQPDRVEFRDDRVLIFASARPHPQTFRYALRVVTVGSFEWPPIQASCMYDAGFASVHGGERVEVGRN